MQGTGEDKLPGFAPSLHGSPLELFHPLPGAAELLRTFFSPECSRPQTLCSSSSSCQALAPEPAAEEGKRCISELAGTSSGCSHSGRRPREERGMTENPALMQQHCSAAGWKRTQPRHGARGGTQTPNPRGKTQKITRKRHRMNPKATRDKVPQARKNITSKVRSFKATQTQHPNKY